MLKKREVEILDYIFKNTNVNTYKIELEFNISTRTARYSIKVIREALEKKEIELLYDTYKKYHFSNQDYIKVESLLNILTQGEKIPNVAKERYYYLIGEYFILKKIDKQKIATNIFTSTSTIHNDFKYVKRMLADEYNIKTSEDLNFEKMIVTIYNLIKKDCYLYDDIYQANTHYLFGEMYDNSKLTEIYKQIVNISEKNISNFKLFQTTWIIYFVYELKKNSSLEVEDYKIPNQTNSAVINILFSNHIRLNQTEYSMLEKVLKWIGWSFENDEYLNFKEKVKDYLFEVQAEMYVDIDYESEDFQFLVHHLTSLSYRLNKGILLTEAAEQEIRHKFRYSYYMASDLCKYIFPKNYKRLNECEIALLTVYMRLILFPVNNQLKILVICNSGYGITKLLMKWTKQYFGSRTELIDYCSKSNVHNMVEAEKYDFIIKTVRHEELNIPSVTVDSIPVFSDVKKVETTIDNLRNTKDYLSKSTKLNVVNNSGTKICNIQKNSKFPYFEYTSMIKNTTCFIVSKSNIKNYKLCTTKLSNPIYIKEKQIFSIIELQLPIEFNPEYTNLFNRIYKELENNSILKN